MSKEERKTVHFRRPKNDDIHQAIIVKLEKIALCDGQLCINLVDITTCQTGTSRGLLFLVFDLQVKGGSDTSTFESGTKKIKFQPFRETFTRSTAISKFGQGGGREATCITPRQVFCKVFMKYTLSVGTEKLVSSFDSNEDGCSSTPRDP